MELSTEYPVDILLPPDWRKPVCYRLRQEIHIQGYIVPRGFVSDGATIPRWLWAIFPPVCRYFPAAILHDYLLKRKYTYKEANRVFRLVLDELNIRPWRRFLLSTGVGFYGIIREIFHGQ